MCNTFIIILNWNGLNDTIDCVKSLHNQTYKEFCIIIVDNHSTNNSINHLRNIFPEIQIISNNINLGYAGGMNVGIKIAIHQGAKKVLLLNNDTIADRNMLNELIINSSDRVDVSGPLIFYEDEPERIWSMGGKINKLLLEMQTPLENNISIPQKVLRQDFLPGCALLIHTDIFKDIGLFDENFYPGYYEDLDFCLRVKRKEYPVKVITSAKLYHKVSSASGGQYSPQVQFLKARNSGLYFRKNMELWNAPFIIIYRILSAMKKSIKLLLNKDYECLIAMWIGLINGWLGLFKQKANIFLDYYK
jgi:GT2 family glycosyltransferase